MTIKRIRFDNKNHKLSQKVVSEEGIKLRDWIALARIVATTESDKELLDEVEKRAANILDAKLFEVKKLSL